MDHFWENLYTNLHFYCRVVSGSRDATLRVWDINGGACLHVLVGHLAAVRCVQYDGKLVVSGAYDYMVKVWNPELEECLHTLQGHTNRVYSLQVSFQTSGCFNENTNNLKTFLVRWYSCGFWLIGHINTCLGRREW